MDVYQARVEYEYCPGRDANRSWTHKAQDYCADFYLTAKRTLPLDEFQVFRLHFVLGFEYNACCRFLRVDRGAFFTSVYRIEEKLGRVYRELRPYALFPPDEYFGGSVRKAKILAMPAPEERHEAILHPPVGRVA